MVSMGGDFAYGNALLNFKSMDHLISYFNSHYSNITLMYSTAGEYIDALNSQKDITWPTKYDDMFPYADLAEDYWTGYFTSRANSKRQVRVGSSNLHASNKLFALKAIE